MVNPLVSTLDLHRRVAPSLCHNCCYRCHLGIGNEKMNSQYDKPKRERWRQLDAGDAGRIAIVSFGSFGLSMTILVCMGFQPGWANGWPVSKHVVFASFVTAMLVVGVVSLVTTVLVMLCFAFGRYAKRPYVGWSSFFLVLLLLLTVIAASIPGAYAIVHAAIAQDWR